MKMRAALAVACMLGLALLGQTKTQGAVIVMADSQVSTVAPLAADVLDSDYETNLAGPPSPGTLWHSVVFRLFDTVAGVYIPITSISSMTFTVGANTTGSTVNVNYSGSTIAPVGGGSPQVSLHDGVGADVTSPEYGQPWVGNTFNTQTPVMAVVVTGQAIPPGTAGGVYNPDTVGEVQTGAYNTSLGYTAAGGGTTTITSTTGTYTAIPEPNPALLAFAAAAGFMVLRRRRA